MENPDTSPQRASETSAQVAVAEAELRRLGIEGVRVYHHGDLARLRVHSSADPAIWAGLLRAEIIKAVRSAGFRHVSVDLEDESAD
ncbi:hypothetical protein [Agromyces sp. ZXT2-6]|uniref:hypothetical protein n=1 Tax=Agromyces sp. ZXT2-6 TaxID=3461153 RepID=UPI004054F7E2